MAGADGGAGPGAGPGRRWDVALSFAGAQRDYVEQVARALKARGVRCFYDADEQVRLWGTYLAEELPAIYARRVGGGGGVRLRRVRGPGLDPAGAPGRVQPGGGREPAVYVLPARFDDTPLPGLLPDVVGRRPAPLDPGAVR